MCRALDAVVAKSASRLPQVVGALEATVGLDRAMASYTASDANRLG